MDLKTQQVLKLIDSHLRIKNFLTILCYALIIGGLFVYIFYAVNRSNAIKLVNDYKKNPKEYETEKIMTNPRIDFQHNDSKIYHIQAKKAFHKNEQEVILYDVFATGDIGKITAGELKIDDEGNHLVFTKNPVLILNKTEK
jgi:hypothetical protein